MVLNKKTRRIRRSGQTRVRIALQRSIRLTVHRTNQHIYASIISSDGSKVLATASTSEVEVRQSLSKNGDASSSAVNGGNIAAAVIVGRRIAEKAQAVGVQSVAFDRAGFAYHGRVKALADAARAAGLKF